MMDSRNWRKALRVGAATARDTGKSTKASLASRQGLGNSSYSPTWTVAGKVGGWIVAPIHLSWTPCPNYSDEIIPSCCVSISLSKIPLVPTAAGSQVVVQDRQQSC